LRIARGFEWSRLCRRRDVWSRDFQPCPPARQLYEDTWLGVKVLERRGQLAIGAASVFYHGILDEIEKNDYDVFNYRASLSAFMKASLFPSLWDKVKTS
jgi:phytoene/squalene synthetase